MSASPETLHLLAHQAQLRARTDADWWDNPLDTGLAAVSAARHPPAFRHDGELAVTRLRRWLRDGQARRVSADVAAIALTAAAAASLGLRNRELDAAAVDAAEDMATRTRRAAPLLHVALTAWGLDTLVPDRGDSPWPAMHDHLERGAPTQGRDVPLATLAGALCAPMFEAATLVRRLLGEIPGSPSLEDGAVLLWVLTVAIERSAQQLDSSDTGLQALVDRRTELAMRMAQELDSAAFLAPEVTDFDPTEEISASPSIFLSPLEALLLDISLASRERDESWLRFEEAATLFGRREHAVLATLARRTAMLVAAIGGLAGALLAVILILDSVKTLVATPAGVILASGFASLSGVIWVRQSDGPVPRAITAFSMTLTLTAALDLVNELMRKPPVSGAAGVIAGILLPALAGVAIATLPHTRSS